jgi:hypothetical protein
MNLSIRKMSMITLWLFTVSFSFLAGLNVHQLNSPKVEIQRIHSDAASQAVQPAPQANTAHDALTEEAEVPAEGVHAFHGGIRELANVPQAARESGKLFFDRRFYDDVLLIVNFNVPFYTVIPRYLTLYGEFFRNILFVGEEDITPDEAQRYGIEFMTVYTSRGKLSECALRDVILKYPNYTGYLWTNDDTMLNPYKLSRNAKGLFSFPVASAAFVACNC